MAPPQTLCGITFHISERGHAAAACIKPAFLGGLHTVRRLRDLCIHTGMQMRIDGPWCGDIASAAILHLALGTPPALLIAGCDPREPLDLNPVLNGLFPAGNGWVQPTSAAGLGLKNLSEALGEPAYSLR